MPPGGVIRRWETIMSIDPIRGRRYASVTIATCATLFIGGVARAQTVPDPTLTQLPTVSVTGTQPRADTLDAPNATGTTLGLTAKETPATIDTIDAKTMAERGYDHVEDTADTLPGVTSGGSPGDPVGLSVRGFTVNEISMLRDGVYLGPASMVNRPENSFNLQSVELLQGPASVLYGQGAVAGALNVVTKQPAFGPTTWDGAFSYGSFNTITAGVGVNTQLSDSIAVRLDLSRTSSSGYVHDDDPNSLNFTGSLLWKMSDTVTLKLGLDVLHDNLPSYYGTPLVPTADAPRPGGQASGHQRRRSASGGGSSASFPQCLIISSCNGQLSEVLVSALRLFEARHTRAERPGIGVVHHEQSRHRNGDCAEP